MSARSRYAPWFRTPPTIVDAHVDHLIVTGFVLFGHEPLGGLSDSAEYTYRVQRKYPVCVVQMDPQA